MARATFPSTPTPSISRHRTNLATVFIICIEEAGGDQNTYVFDSTIATMGDYANGIFSIIQAGGAGGNIYVEFKKIDSQSRPTIYAKGRSANGIRVINQSGGEGDHPANGAGAWRDGAGSGYGKVYIDTSDSEITTYGLSGHAISAYSDENEQSFLLKMNGDSDLR